jgi:uncharacterized metal-binding protein
MPRHATAPEYGCRHCATVASFTGESARMPTGCPTRTLPSLTHRVSPYLLPARQELMLAADETPFDDGGRLRTRVEELVHFARRRGLQRIGIAFCVSMRKEAQRLAELLEAGGLETALACCRVGAVDPSEAGLPRAHPERFASMCNPVAQARLLDEARVDLVAAVGLCLGHDLILQEESVAPVTTLVVKDRVHDHQPILALRSP